MPRPVAFLALALAATPASAFLQVQSFGDRWAALEPVAMPPAFTALSGPGNEVDFAVGDLDADGDPDLVIVRKEPYTKSGPRSNLLLMNEGGALVNRTPAFATASDVAGDQGFLTPTTDRDVALADVDQDGALDVITAPALMDGQPKHVSHPRVYRNLGHAAGAWQGLRYEEARIPLLLTDQGLAEAPHAIAVAAGDVDADGDPDLYLNDHDSGFEGYSEPGHQDLDDRLLINQGDGYFADETALRMPAIASTCGFGVGCGVADFNQDGAPDVLRGSAPSSDQVNAISVTYNDPADVGRFQVYQEVFTITPYSVSHADLNRDDRIDLVVGSDSTDRYLLNQGVDALGRVVWGPARLFDFLAGADDGFVGQVLIRDLDQDGWNDVLIADQDLDVSGSFRRLHVYHNLGGAPGEDVVLREERESAAAGWIGVDGWQETDLKGTYDVAALDLDGDGFDELVVGRSAGLFLWRNATGARVCQTDLGFAGPGDARLSLCGAPLTGAGDADLVVEHARADAPGLLAFGVIEAQIPFAGGTLIPIPIGISTFTTDEAGKWVLPKLSSSGVGTVTLQAIVIDAAQPSGFAITNAVRAQVGP